MRKLRVVDPALHFLHLLWRHLRAAWSSNAKDHTAATTVSAPCCAAVQRARSDHCGAEPTRVHGVFDEIIVGKKYADLAVATQLAVAKNAIIFIVDLQALNFL